MKTSDSSMRFAPSKTTAHQLDELSRITQMTPKAIIDDIVAFELANMFGSTDDSTNSLRRYLDRHDYSREQAAQYHKATRYPMQRSDKSIQSTIRPRLRRSKTECYI